MGNRERNGAVATGERPKNRWKKYLAFFLLFGVAALWHLFALSSGPSQGVITQKEAGYDLRNADLPPAIEEHEGKYFSFFLAGTYEEKRHETPEREGNVLEQTYFSQGGGSGRKMAVTVEKRPSNGLEEISSYRFRKLHPEEYMWDSFQWSENKIPIFKKGTVVYEVTGYMEKNGLVASISISSAVETPEKLIGDFSDIIKSFRWTSHESQ